jgi:hypothetical protein
MQLREELYQLVSHWRSKNERIVDLECSFNLEPVDEQSYDGIEDPEDEELQCLPTQLEPLLPQESLGKLQRDWALEKEEWATVHSLRRMSNFENLSEEERANVVLETKQEFVDTKMKQWLAKSILNGQFVPEDNEDIASQWKRCWAQINIERVQRSYHPSSTIMTCCYCGRTCDKVLQRGTKVNLPVHPDCPINTAHHLGWELVRGTFEDMFPSNNIFVLFFHSVAPGLVINHWQLSKAFSNFCLENQWHPQA